MTTKAMYLMIRWPEGSFGIIYITYHAYMVMVCPQRDTGAPWISRLCDSLSRRHASDGRQYDVAR